jgi:hypothetical protein
MKCTCFKSATVEKPVQSPHLENFAFIFQEAIISIVRATMYLSSQRLYRPEPLQKSIRFQD